MALLAIPIAGVAALFVGETVSDGLVVSFQHAVEVLPLLVLAVLAWWRPLIAGSILAGVGTLIAAAFLLLALLEGAFPLEAVAVVELGLLLPVVAGILLVLDARRSPQPVEDAPRPRSGRPA